MKKKKFWKIYFIIVIILCILIAATLTTLYMFLASYEKSIPTHQVDMVINWINNNDVDKIVDKLVVENDEINTKDILMETLKFDDGDYFYTKKMQEYKDDRPVYSIYKDSKEVGNVYLKKKDEKNFFNSSRWEVDYIKGFLNNNKSITIIAPSDAKVYVNNVLINEKHLVDNNYKMEKFAYMSPYVEMDTFSKYVIDDVFNPYVKVNYNGKEKELKGNEDVYKFTYDDNQELLNSLKPYIEEFTKKYTRYVVREVTFGSITPYILSSSNAYSFLKDIALTNLWSGDHDASVFSGFEYSNMQYYNDSAFSVQVNYTYSFVVIDGDKKEFDTKITLYMVKQNGKWYIVGLNT